MAGKGWRLFAPEGLPDLGAVEPPPPLQWRRPVDTIATTLEQLKGSWNLKPNGAWHEFDTVQLRYPYGSSPTGSLVFTESRVTVVVVPDTRFAPTPGQTIEAHSGRFVLEGSDMIITVDVSSRPEWKGTDQKRFISLSRAGDLLFVTSPRQFSSLYGSVPFSSAFTWRRND